MDSKDKPKREHRPTVEYSPGGVMVASIMAFFAIAGGIGRDGTSAFVPFMTSSLILFVRSFSPPSPPISIRRGTLTFFGSLLAGGLMGIFVGQRIVIKLGPIIRIIPLVILCVVLLYFGFQHPKENE